jgi:hypothetical protein
MPQSTRKPISVDSKKILPADEHQAAIFLHKRRFRNVAVFWAALSQGNPLDRVSMYTVSTVCERTKGLQKPRADRIWPTRFFLQRGRQVL